MSKKTTPTSEHDHSAQNESATVEETLDSIEEQLADSSIERDIDDADIFDESDFTDEANTAPKRSIFKPVAWLLILAAIGYGLYYFGTYFFEERKKNAPPAEQAIVDQYQAIGANANANTTTQTSSAVNSANPTTPAETTSHQVAQLIEQLRSENAREFESLRQEQQSQLADLRGQLDSANRRLLAIDAAKSNQWAFAEAEYLVRQAAQRLAFTRDTAPLIALLQAADQKIATLGTGQYLSLRQAIQNDISRLRASGSLDLEGVTLALESLKSQVHTLKLASIQLDKTNTSHDAERTNTSSDAQSSGMWQSFKDSFGNALDKVYTVHHYDESVKPFVSPNQDILLRQNMMLQLQAAQLAALSHDQALYQATLQELKNWTAEYFQQQKPETQAFLWQVTDLSQKSVQLSLPQRLNSMSELRLHRPENTNNSQSIESQPEAATEAVESVPEMIDAPHTEEVDAVEADSSDDEVSNEGEPTQ